MTNKFRHVDNAYQSVVIDVLRNGSRKIGRNGPTISKFGVDYKIDMGDGFPILTTKKINFNNILAENIWFLQGEDHIRNLEQHTDIWTPWADEDGHVGPVYGVLWRDFNGVDQLRKVRDRIRTSPTSRRHVVTSWDPSKLDDMALPPCHLLFIFNVNGGRLNLHLTQRSCDCAIGLPYNIAGYSFLLHMMAKETAYPPGEFHHTIVDAHVYKEHVKNLQRQLKREPYPLPEIKIPSDKRLLELDYDDIEDITLEGYNHHDFIKYEIIE